MSWRTSLADYGRLLHASARLIAGRRYWIAALIPLTWTAFQVMRLLIRWRVDAYTPRDAVLTLLGFPLVLLGIGLGVRIIAGDIDRRTLEIAYTVPGGTQRVWLAKLVAGLMLLTVAAALLGLATSIFCTDFLLGDLYGALQGAVFYMVLGMALATLTKSEAAGALICAVLLIVNLPMQNLRISPLWNTDFAFSVDATEALAHAVQNRVGFAIAIAVIAALAFGSAERRERLLGG